MPRALPYKAITAFLFVALAGSASAMVYLYQDRSTQISHSSDLNNRVSDLDTQITNLNKQITDLNTQLAQLQSQNSQLVDTKSQLTSQIELLQAQISELQTQLAQLQAKLKALKASPRNATTMWVASDGGGVELGGHVTIQGLPSSVVFGRTYVVGFNFTVEWFDWGDTLKPQSITWFAQIGCVDQKGICVSSVQNITLDQKVVDGTFTKGQTFAVTANWNLFQRPSGDAVNATVGIKIPALVECHDSTVCAPVGQSYPAQKYAFLAPDASTAFTVYQ